MVFIRTAFLFIFLSTQSTFEQEEVGGIAKYTIKLSEDYLDFDATLTFGQTASLFEYKKQDKSKWVKIRAGGIGSQVVFTDTTGYLVYREFADNDMLIRGFCKINKPLLYKDKIEFNWNISSEEKKIGGLYCKKATTSFRGRSYTAWYAPSIPSSAGPWKFHGLPGLILEISDSAGDVSISISSIEMQATISEIKNDFVGSIVSREEYDENADKAWEEEWHRNNAIIAELQAEYPDATITNNNAPRKRPATEFE